MKAQSKHIEDLEILTDHIQEELKDMETGTFPEMGERIAGGETVKRLRKLASAYAGFNIEEPQDFSQMSIGEVSHEVKQAGFDDGYPGKMFVELKTRLVCYHMVEGEDCEVEITIVRKSQKIPRV